MKKKTFILTVLFVVILLCASCFILDALRHSQEKEITSLKAKIIPLEFTLLKNDQYMEVKYSFLDIAGQPVCSKTETLRGNELFIDCVVKQLNNDIKVAFPVILYSNVIPAAEGIVLVQEYNNNGFPEIFHGVSAKEKKHLERIYAEVLQEINDTEAFRSSPHIMASTTKTTYQLVARIRGGLEIIKAEKQAKSQD